MPTTHTFWISGSNAQPYKKGYFISDVRDGFGSAFYMYGTQWFFFPIPTPAIIDGQNASVVKVFLLYKTSGTAVIKHVHLDDGRTKLTSAVIPNGVYGEHDANIEPGWNCWQVGPFEMNYGLNMGVYVDFGPPTKQAVPGIEFVAAGAEFQTP